MYTASGSQTTWSSTIGRVTPLRDRRPHEAVSDIASITVIRTPGWSDRGQSAIPPDRASKDSDQVDRILVLVLAHRRS